MVLADRTILHVDMDAFYAAVEQRDNPQLRGRPLVVGGSSNRGVVAAASYEVRKFGVRSAMPISEARRRCPELLIVKPRMDRYKAVSRKIFGIFRAYTPEVEGLSLDEAFLDVTGSLALYGSGRAIGERIKRDIVERTGLTASVGVAGNKLVAKIASDLDKPDGIVVVTRENLRSTLDPLAVEVIPGVGRQTLRRLHDASIRTVADLRTADDSRLRPIFGRYTPRMRDKAAGIDTRPVSTARVEKSISSEETFDTDLSDRNDLDAALLALTAVTARRLRKASLAAGTVQVKIRQSDFRTCTRQKQLRPPASNTDQIFEVARTLLGDWLEANPDARIRLLGVGTANLAAADQADLFGPQETGRQTVDSAVDSIQERYGLDAMSRARNLPRP